MLVLLILLAFIAPIVIVQPLQDAIVLPKFVTTITFTGVALIWAGVQLARGRRPNSRWPATLWVPIVAFVIVNVLAWAFALNWRWSLMGERLRYQGLGAVLVYVLLFGVAATAVRTTRDLRWLAFGLLAGAFGATVYAMIQKAGLDWSDWAGVTINRPASTVGQPNSFAAYLVVVTSTSGFLFFVLKQRWQQFVLALIIIAMLFALLFTQSRSGLIALFVMIVIWAVAAIIWYAHLRHGRMPTLRQTAVIAAGAAAACAVVLVLGLLSTNIGQAGVARRFDDTGALQGESVGGRISLWRMALRMTADRPLLGHGQDSFPLLFDKYRDRPDYPGIGSSNIEPESAHNFILDLASGTGVLGLLSFLALFGAVLWHAMRLALARDDLALRAGLLALGAGATGYLVAICFGFMEGMTTWLFWLVLGALAGLIVAAPEEESEAAVAAVAAEPPARARAQPHPLAMAAGAMVLALLGAVALGWAATLIAADLAAQQAVLATTGTLVTPSVRLADRAVRLNPLMRDYLRERANLEESPAVEPGDREAALRTSIATYETMMDRFPPSAFDMLGLASAEFALAKIIGESVEPAIADFEQAVALDPYNFLLRDFVAEFYDQHGYPELAEGHRLVILCWTDAC